MNGFQATTNLDGTPPMRVVPLFLLCSSFYTTVEFQFSTRQNDDEAVACRGSSRVAYYNWLGLAVKYLNQLSEIAAAAFSGRGRMLTHCHFAGQIEMRFTGQIHANTQATLRCWFAASVT